MDSIPLGFIVFVTLCTLSNQCPGMKESEFYLRRV